MKCGHLNLPLGPLKDNIDLFGELTQWSIEPLIAEATCYWMSKLQTYSFTFKMIFVAFIMESQQTCIFLNV